MRLAKDGRLAKLLRAKGLLVALVLGTLLAVTPGCEWLDRAALLATDPTIQAHVETVAIAAAQRALANAPAAASPTELRATVETAVRGEVEAAVKAKLGDDSPLVRDLTDKLIKVGADAFTGNTTAAGAGAAGTLLTILLALLGRGWIAARGAKTTETLVDQLGPLLDQLVAKALASRAASPTPTLPGGTPA